MWHHPRHFSRSRCRSTPTRTTTALQAEIRPGKFNPPHLGLSALCLIVLVGWISATRSADLVSDPSEPVGTGTMPILSPDYSNIVIPPNIAPLNFRVLHPGKAWRVRLVGPEGNPLDIRTDSPTIKFPAGPWKAFLEANRGQSVRLEVAAQSSDGMWTMAETATNAVASEPIDSHLVYRLLRPAYSVYGELGIYQRDLESFRETVLLENSSFENGCVNCHTFNQNRPDVMALHIRLRHSGNPMLLVQSNQVTQVTKTAGYLSWHPSGRLLAYSSNRFRLFFHTVGETRDVFDVDSDLGLYRVDENALVVPPVLAQPDRLENWPCWSADGRHLYFCSAPKLRFERYDRIRYDLLRVSYDAGEDRWGEAETMISAPEIQKSVTEPRVSPDGRWLLCCLLPYGNFPPYQPESDLFLLDLQTRRLRPAGELNSDQCDSYASWSSNGRWVVFSSKRMDGLFSRPFFSYLNAQGKFSKPVLMPQEDPAFYDAFIRNFNRPELITGPVTVHSRQLAEGIFHPRRRLLPTGSGGSAIDELPYEQTQDGAVSPDHAAGSARRR